MGLEAFFQSTAWLASWLALFILACTETTILYLLLRYLRRIFGHLDPDSLARLGTALESYLGAGTAGTAASRAIGAMAKREQSEAPRPPPEG